MDQEDIAYFTPEIAIHQDLPFYSGGLGVVAGDDARSARSLGLPIIYLSILPRYGYYDQFNYQDGNSHKMGIRYLRWQKEEEYLDDIGLTFPININHSLKKKIPPNYVKVWKLKDKFGMAPVYFLDTDIDRNDELGRLNTRHLYGGTVHSGISPEDCYRRKLAQYYIFGKGWVKALRRLKFKIDKFHLNESHSYFAAQEILSGALKRGMNWNDAISFTKSKVVFTTHTPVKEGHPVFKMEDMLEISSIDNSGVINQSHLQELGGNIYGEFNFTKACLKLAGKANAVSKKHLTVALDMWKSEKEIAPLISITNGVNHKFWQYPEFKNASNPEEIAAAKLMYKQDFFTEFAPHFDLQTLTIGWGRRCPPYKRQRLPFYDTAWLSQKLKNKEIQFIIAGKPHPDDDTRIRDWEYILNLSHSEDFPNLVVITGYELDLMKKMNAGVDLWLNTPRSPNEASGSSGMKGNGAINFSTPDGWNCESTPENWFSFGSHSPGKIETQDALDGASFREKMDKEVIPMFYKDRQKWNEIALRSTREVEEKFDSDRVVKEHFEKLYI